MYLSSKCTCMTKTSPKQSGQPSSSALASPREVAGSNSAPPSTYFPNYEQVRWW